MLLGLTLVFAVALAVDCDPPIDGCAECDSSKTACTRCDPAGATPYLKKENPSGSTGTCVTADGCTANNDHYTDSSTTNAKECKPCSQDQKPNLAGTGCFTCPNSGATANCVRCDEENRCAKCGDAAPYLTNDKTCATVEECTKDNAHYADSSTKTCKQCGVGEKPNAAGSQCFACPNSGTTASCDRCSADGVCEACASGKVLTPTLLCLDDCGGLPGYYADTANKRCAKCSEGCRECTGAATQCTACPAGKRLAYTNSADYGTCVEECAASTGSASGSCRTCGASIGGTKYCSGCSVGAEIPVNGVCQTNPSRAAICAEPDNAGGCNKCATGYFLLEKGCYEAAKQPGVQVCKTADGGLCTTCASGLAANGGDCSAQTCHASCRTCSAASDASKCTTCADGYYKQSSDTTDGECQRCSQGKEGCTLCKYSSGFICLSTDPFSGGSGDNTADPSVNKGTFSTGVIAGISVAVIVVVGGLVGFLCWWFICRGKA